MILRAREDKLPQIFDYDIFTLVLHLVKEMIYFSKNTNHFGPSFAPFGQSLWLKHFLQLGHYLLSEALEADLFAQNRESLNPGFIQLKSWVTNSYNVIFDVV